MPRGLRKIDFTVDTEGLTRFGGLILFLHFCKSIGLRRFLQRTVNWGQCGRKYQPVDLFLTHLFVLAAGLGRIENTITLRHNGLLPPLLGLAEFPHRDTLRAFLLTATPKLLQSLQAAHDRVRVWALNGVLPLWSATLDIDTTSLRIFGRQMEGGVVGYVPHYAHQRCYNARLLTEARTQLSLAGELRPGNTHPVDKVVDFVDAGLNLLPSRIAASRIRLRADASFYDHKLVEFLDGKLVAYTITAKVTRRLLASMGRIHYRNFATNWQVGEFHYQPLYWKKAERFVVIRKLVSLIEPPITLFVLEKYAYHILLSNVGLLPERIWQSFNRRMAQELLIKELKAHYALTKVPSRKLLANQVYLEILLWSYDLTTLFKYLCLPSQCHHWSVSTIRRELWLLPAQLVRTDNRNRLKLPRFFRHRDIFIQAYEAAQKIRTLG